MRQNTEPAFDPRVLVRCFRAQERGLLKQIQDLLSCVLIVSRFNRLVYVQHSEGKMASMEEAEPPSLVPQGPPAPEAAPAFCDFIPRGLCSRAHCCPVKLTMCCRPPDPASLREGQVVGEATGVQGAQEWAAGP